MARHPKAATKGGTGNRDACPSELTPHDPHLWQLVVGQEAKVLVQGEGPARLLAARQHCPEAGHCRCQHIQLQSPTATPGGEGAVSGGRRGAHQRL